MGVAVAVVFALVPVGVHFDNDPLLRLGQLDPQLSPQPATAVCGSPVSNLRNEPQGISLYEAARAHACEQASVRRLLAAVAAGTAIVMAGLIGLTRTEPDPGRSKRVALPSASG